MEFPSAQILDKEVIPTLPKRGGSVVLDESLALAGKFVRKALARNYRVLGIGVALAELVDHAGRITSNQTIDWQNLEAGDRFKTIAPTVIESDVRAPALAEAMFGAGRQFGSFTYITVGTGISCTLVQDKTPYKGARGNALLLASAPLSSVCASCGAESHQVLEEFASGPALVTRYNSAALRNVAKAEDVTGAAMKGDAVALDVVQTAGYALGNSVAFLVNVLDPQAVVVGGGLGLSGGIYWNSFVSSTRRHIWAAETRDLPILPAELGVDAGLIGAAALLWQTG